MSDPSVLTLSESEILAYLDSGLAVVVRLPGLYQPYGPLLRRLRDEGRLVRIGRDTIWGNQHRLRKGATTAERVEVIDRYGHDLDERPDLLARLPELCGKALGCWCKPLACHGDLLATRVNALQPITRK